LAPDDQAERWARLVGELRDARDRRDQAEGRKGWALYGFLAAITVVVGWGMWRLDDRSERLFALVAQERAAAAACP
jgi:hypothetical protein